MAPGRVGKRVRVYWSEEEEWFEGTVQDFEESQGYYVVYDDGDERWESAGRPMLVEGEEEAQTAAHYDELRLRAPDRAPEMMEPPASSPGSNYDDEFQGMKQSEQQETDLRPEQDGADQDGNDFGGEDPDDASDGDQSTADSEMPQTFAKSSNHQRRPAPSAVPVPVTGLLEGQVLRATGLQTSRALAPNAFVRVSFVESGDARAMLQCKETLSTTEIVRGCVNPVWSEELRGEAGFRLELRPRIVPPATKPAWHQLPGAVLFTVFSSSRSDGSSRNEHIGQATVSLRSLLPDLLTTSPFTTRALELRSRSGKRLGRGNASTRSLFLDDGRAESPCLVASFRFIPTHEKREAPPRSLSLDSGRAPAKTASNRSTRQEKARSAKRTAPARTSSSSINRRRFEKQVARDNRSFAKRLEWKEARRTRHSAQAKTQEQKKVTPPQYGARKHGLQAHSGVNRTKFAHQVAAENKAIGRRLQTILGSDEGARNPEKFSRWAAAEPKDSADCDYMDRDKAHAQDKRRQRQVELDFMMEKAQTTYQQQHQLVDEVTELHESVAALKAQVDALNKGVLRLDILNKKDQHVRDCLLRAAVTCASSTAKASPRQIKSSSTTATRSSSSSDQDDGGRSRKKQECELLTQHRERLLAEKLKLSHELKALNEQEIDLDNEMNDQQCKWEHAIATQLFHRQMDKKNAVQAQKAAQEMKRRQKALELSRDEEEHWASYQAHQELAQLQIVNQLLRGQSGEQPRASRSSSTAVSEYLATKIDKQKTKLQQLQAQVERRRSELETVLAGGGNERLRKRVQELQQLVFLCKSQASHVKKAERVAQRKGEQVDLEFQRRLFSEQTETEIVLKR